MVCFFNVQGVDRIIYSIFSSLNPQRKNRTLPHFFHTSSLTSSVAIVRLGMERQMVFPLRFEEVI
ncbi:MAG: hypothetical protein HY649_07115 [Acidobacteria bacterium]|nr:hypothetical protein [Acidobacteriota bacterium]